MAIIYSYPKKTTPNAGDILVITDSEQTAPNKNRTKSLTIGDLVSFTKGFTSYVAKVSQTGTNAPVPTVIHNDTGLTFSFDTYSSAGIYDLKPNVNFTDVSKIYAVVSSFSLEGSGARIATVKDIQTTYIRITNISISTQALADEIVNGMLEIRIYE